MRPVDEWSQERFLTWFGYQGFPIFERDFQWGQFRYYHFASSGDHQRFGRYHGYGRSPDRRIAAIKCASEVIERKCMFNFFASLDDQVSTEADIKDLRSGKEVAAICPLPDSDFQTSNGWAVHTNRMLSRQKATDEAFERHLLLKSFILEGWRGFSLVQEIATEQMTLVFLKGKFSSMGSVSGMVIAKSQAYPGISMGYCFGRSQQIGEFSFWESAIFEAIDKLNVMGGQKIDPSIVKKSWIMREVDYFLQSSFDLSIFRGHRLEVEIEDPADQVFLKTFDLRESWNLEFPLFASWAWSPELIPLFHEPNLRPDSKKRIVDLIFSQTGKAISLPQRHPVL